MIKKSIKRKMTVAFIVVMVCLIGSILLFNSLFLERLYIGNKEDVIKKSYYALENGITDAYDAGYTLSDLFNRQRVVNGEKTESSLLRFIRELQEIYGVTVILMDSENNTYSLFQNNSRFDRRMFDYIYKDGVENRNLQVLEKTNNYTIAITTPKEAEGMPPFPRRKNQTSDLECFGFLSDNVTAFLLSIPIESIKEPIDLFNKVLIIVSVIALIIGSIVIFLLSNSLSKPLLELANISKKMSRLEFENKYEGKSQDEIGVLGNSMNEMSDKLEKSIRELKNANYKLKQDLEKKEQLDIMRQEFVANVSHELKTPISLIKGYAEGLATEGIADSKESRYYYTSVIKDEADKMGDMVKNLLNLSSIERGMEELDYSRICLKELACGVSRSFDIKLKEREVNLNIDIDDDIYVWADGYKLEEVIRNYLSNALNHVDDKKIINIYSNIVGEEVVRLIVFNSGTILPQDEQEKIWDKFYKVDKAHTRAYGGTGLGLSIVKAIANEHNTKCGCNGAVKDGAEGMEFYFDLSVK